MKSVFILWHTHRIDDYDDEKLIGVYKTRLDAESAITRLKGKTGFRDTPAGFEIVEYEIGRDHWTEGYVTVS